MDLLHLNLKFSFCSVLTQKPLESRYPLVLIHLGRDMSLSIHSLDFHCIDHTFRCSFVNLSDLITIMANTCRNRLLDKKMCPSSHPSRRGCSPLCWTAARRLGRGQPLLSCQPRTLNQRIRVPSANKPRQLESINCLELRVNPDS